ncbi:unnamed protein product [Caenorhabditis nigoni]
MSRPLIYDLWPTVIERMDLANRILLSQKCPAIRRTDKRRPIGAVAIETSANCVKINNTSFYFEKYDYGKHILVFNSDGDAKTVVLKTNVPRYEAKRKLFATIMKRRSGILKVTNLSIIGYLNFPPNLKLCVQNVKIVRPSYEAHINERIRTLALIADLQKALTADSFPLESLEINNTFALVSSGEAKTVITTRYAWGIQTSDIHRIHVKHCFMDSVTVTALVENWQISEPEIGRHYSMETESYEIVEKYFSTAEHTTGAQVNERLGNKPSSFGLTFPINQEKVLNVFLEHVKKENGMDAYVIHFKIDPKL